MRTRKAIAAQACTSAGHRCWGNPFQIGTYGTRNEVIAQYRVWLWQQIKEQTAVFQELQRLAKQAQHSELLLLCWCKEPDREVMCHGDVVQAALHWLVEKER